MIIVPVKEGENIEEPSRNSRESLKRLVSLRNSVHVSSSTSLLF